jgi:processive 1,2-diacylglycerol beta-glucosyltransferase
MRTGDASHPRILILTLSHGGAHRRAADALRQALSELRPSAAVEVVDSLERCAYWFRAYYDSYQIPLRYWPSLWGWIENVQHQSKSTGPGWLYCWGAQPLFRFIEDFNPDVVVATEVGLCELAAMMKRKGRGSFRLAAVELMAFYRAWIQPEVDLYLVTHEDLGAELAGAGAPGARIVCCGQPIDPAFASLPTREATRARLSVDPAVPMLLVLFGGAGFGNPRLILNELKRIKKSLQVVFITGKNERMEEEIRSLSKDLHLVRVLGWVDKIQEWMVAADLMVSKPGGATVAEGFACGLPMLIFNPLPGNEERTCGWIEKWEAGLWIRKAENLAPAIDRLLTNREELERLAKTGRALARPRAAYDAAEAILKLWLGSS